MSCAAPWLGRVPGVPSEVLLEEYERVQGPQNGLLGSRSARRERACRNEQMKGRNTFRIGVRLANFSRSWAVG